MLRRQLGPARPILARRAILSAVAGSLHPTSCAGADSSHPPPSWPGTDVCSEDKAIPPAPQRFMAERANATIVEVPASHVSFVSQPEAATQLILQAVGATDHSRT